MSAADRAKTKEVHVRVVLSSSDPEFIQLCEPIFVDFLRTMDRRRKAPFGHAGHADIDIATMHELNAEAASSLTHGDAAPTGPNQLPPWFQGFLDRRLVTQLKPSETHCTNITCRKCASKCKRKWDRLEVCVNLSTAKVVFSTKSRPGAAVSREANVRKGCVMCRGPVHALDKTLGLNWVDARKVDILVGHLLGTGTTDHFSYLPKKRACCGYCYLLKD